MTTENDRDKDEAQRRYSIDMSWYQEQGRSFTVLASSRLCPTSQKKKSLKTDAALLTALSQCCSKSEGFISPNMPLMEMIFRLFLANGNEPLSLEEIQAGLQERLRESTEARDISIPKLRRIVDSDRYYGLRPVPTEEPGKPA